LYAVRQYNIALSRRNLPPFVLGEEVVVQPDINNQEEEGEAIIIPDNNFDYETDSDLDWNYDGGINPNQASTSTINVTPQMSVNSTTPDKRANDSGKGGSGKSIHLKFKPLQQN